MSEGTPPSDTALRPEGSHPPAAALVGIAVGGSFLEEARGSNPLTSTTLDDQAGAQLGQLISASGEVGNGHCCIPGTRRSSETAGMRRRRTRQASLPRPAFAGFRFPCDVIVLAVRWYLRFALSYRDVEELLAERGVEVDHVTIYRWVQRFTPLLADAARPPARRRSGRHAGMGMLPR